MYLSVPFISDSGYLYFFTTHGSNFESLNGQPVASIHFGDRLKRSLDEFSITITFSLVDNLKLKRNHLTMCCFYGYMGERWKRMCVFVSVLGLVEYKNDIQKTHVKNLFVCGEIKSGVVNAIGDNKSDLRGDGSFEMCAKSDSVDYMGEENRPPANTVT